MRLTLYILALIIWLTFPIATAFAGPIYVYKQSGGVIRFSSVPPPAGVKADVFTAKEGRVSKFWVHPVYKGKLHKNLYNGLIEAAANQHGLTPSLIKAVIHAESAFNPKAVSPKGARGLMQLMPQTAHEQGVSNSFDPRSNIFGGSRYLASLLRRFSGNVRLALAAYNAGPGAVEEHGGIPPYSETRTYVARVLELKRRYESKA